MNLSAGFIRRPVMTTLVMLGIVLFGFVGYRKLPVSDLPNVDFPTINVAGSLPGASPETMATAVATPLERQFSTIAGLDSMTSTSTLGGTQITLQFALDKPLEAAAQDVQSAIAAAARQLPPGMPTPPSYNKVNPADQPVLYLAITSPTMPLSRLDEYAQTMIAQRVSTVSGVAQVQVFGSQKFAVRVQLDPQALASRGIGIDEVATAIQSQNVNLPTGTLYGPSSAFTVEANGQLTSAAAYRPIVVAYRNGSPVRLSELGTVSDSVENDKTAAWFVDRRLEGESRRALILAVQKQPGTNTIAVTEAVKALLPSFERQLPANVSLRILFDRSQSIRESVADVKFTLLLTLGLVILVIFLFLRNVRATLIPSLALPVSIVGTFAIMWGLGYSLDNLSLLALTLSVGFVVDDAIVMLENVVRHMEMGKSRMEAAMEGSKEIAFTILSMTISLAAVFIPVYFMGGIVGRLFHEFAVTIGAAILVSGFVSLSLTPMLCSRFLRQHDAEHSADAAAHGRLYLFLERIFDGSLRIYERGLDWSLGHPKTLLSLSAAVLAATAWAFGAVPKGFLPSEDLGQVFGFTEAAEGISFRSMAEHQQAAAAILAEDPNIDGFMSSCGARGSINASNSGVLFARLKPREERKLGVDQVIQVLRVKLAKVPGIRVYLQNPPPIRIGGSLSKSQYQYILFGSDTAELYSEAPKLEAAVRELPGFQDVTSDLRLKNPELSIDIDRDRAAALGVTPERIEQTLYSAYGSRQVSTIYAATNQYQVILEVAPDFQLDPASIEQLHVRNSRNELVPLRAVAKLGRSLGPLSVAHSGQLPSVTISFNLKPGVSIGDAVAKVDSLAKKTLPATISTGFSGAAQAFQSSFAGLGLLLVVAVLVIYLVLGILYESFVHPVTILSALPFAGFGALLTLLVFRTELSIYAFVGVILLVGLVKKNGIMMVDFAIEARKGGKSAHDAIREACLVRFRPIMMTTLAALMGTLPIALGWGAGAASRRPLGLAVVGGLLFSQILTLYVTPVFYLVLDRFAGKEAVIEAEPAGPTPAKA